MTKAAFLLSCTLLLGLSLRLFNLTSIPFGFFCDEAANGYNAYRLLTSGKDEYNVPWPFYFRSFGDYRNPVAIYSMILPIWLLGLSEFSIRFTMVTYGILSILALYLFIKESFVKHPHRETIAQLSALFLAISPWHIHFSRTGFEFTPLIFYLCLGLYFFYKFLNTNRRYFLVLSTLSFVVDFYTYYPIQIVLPLFLFGLVLIYCKNLFVHRQAKFTLLCLCLFCLGLIPFGLGIRSGIALTRFTTITSSANQSLSAVLPQFFKTYVEHFSLDFLFTKGDIDFPGHFVTRHSVRGLGQLYIYQLPLILLGLWLIFKYDLKLFGLVILWLLLYPLGSSVAFADGPLANRSIFGLVLFQLLSAVGLAAVIHFHPRLRLLTTSISLLVVGGFLLYYAHLYFDMYPLYSSDYWGWQYGPSAIMSYYLTQVDNYDYLYLSGEFNGTPQAFINFYDPTNLCHNKCLGGDFNSNPNLASSTRALFALTPQALGQSTFKAKFILQKEILYPNNQVAFLIGSVNTK